MRRPPAAVFAVVVASVLAGAAALVVLCVPPGAEGAEDARVRDVSAALETVRAEHDVPGLVAVTVEGDRVVASGAAGVRRRGGTERVTVEDRFHLGSCTKAMTATLCAALVADGKLAWDASPADVLAGRVRSRDAGWKDATLEMLLRNRGGAPAALDAGGLWERLWRHPGPPREARIALAAGVLGRPPASRPGTRSEYSNAGFALAGAMAEETADVAFEDLMRKRLFAPLGMDRAGFGAPGSRARVDQPRGHTAAGAVVEPGPGDDNPDAIAPAGKVHAPLPDWAKFVAFHLQRGRGASGTLAKIDFDRLHVPPEGGDYAMGWGVATRPWAKGAAAGDRGRVLTHTGSNTMWTAVVWMAPERGFALLAACNQGGDRAAAACDAAVAALLRERSATAK